MVASLRPAPRRPLRREPALAAQIARLAAALDRHADALLATGRVRRAEELAHRAEQMRTEAPL